MDTPSNIDARRVIWYTVNTKTNNDSPMGRGFSRSISERSARATLFVFFSLLVFGTAFFVFADDDSNGKNIFQDSDQDGLSNDEEKLYGTDPNNRDSDGDGYSDGVEIESGYDPLKMAPGDKVVQAAPAEAPIAATSAAQRKNLTEQVSQELATTIKTSSEGSGPLTAEEMNASMQKIVESSTQEVVLPEIDIKEIKIKAAPSKKLSEKKRKEQEREDILEYLTVMSYLMVNNSPKNFRTQDEFSNVLSSLSTESFMSLSLGNMSPINDIAAKGENILKETKDIEVPRAMLDTHVKALKIAKYAVQLKPELAPNPDDPLGQIAALSKLQGLIGVMTSFSQEISDQMAQYSIEQIPVSL